MHLRDAVWPALFLAVALGGPAAEPDGLIARTNVFVSGQGGYHTYRIPSLMVTARGTLLAFAEGRKGGSGDAGDIDLLCRRSTDQGRTWEAVRTVWDDGPNTCGNPCPVIDPESGTIRLLMTWNRGDDPETKIIAQQSRDTRADPGRFLYRNREYQGTVPKPEPALVFLLYRDPRTCHDFNNGLDGNRNRKSGRIPYHTPVMDRTLPA